MMKLSAKKTIIISVASAFCLAVIAMFVCNKLVVDNATGKCYDDVNLISHNKVGLLLGTSPKLKSGRNNVYFDYRISTTVELYNAGKIDYVLVSGDNRKATYNEPEEMQKALMAQGIPEDRIILDFAGFRTLDSVVRANKVFGQNSFTIISQKFHNERALYLCRHYGIYAIAMNARDASAFWGLKTQVREKLARVKLFVDFLVGKQPRFLGEKIEIK